MEAENGDFFRGTTIANEGFITPSPSVMSIENNVESDAFISDLEMDNVSFDGYDGTVLRSIGNRDADLLYDALNAEPPEIAGLDDGYEGHLIAHTNYDFEMDNMDDNMSLDSYTERNLLSSALNAEAPDVAGFDDGYNGALLRNIMRDVPMHDLSYVQTMPLPDGDNVDDLLDDGYNGEYGESYDDGYDGTVLPLLDTDSDSSEAFDDGYDRTVIPLLNVDTESSNDFDDGYDGTVLPLLNTDTESSEGYDDGYDGTVLPLLSNDSHHDEDFDDGYDGTVLPLLNPILQEITEEVPSREDVQEYWGRRIAPEHRFDILQEYRDALRYSDTGTQSTNTNRVNNILNTLATANVITSEEQTELQRRQQNGNRRR